MTTTIIDSILTHEDITTAGTDASTATVVARTSRETIIRVRIGTPVNSGFVMPEGVIGDYVEVSAQDGAPGWSVFNSDYIRVYHPASQSGVSFFGPQGFGAYRMIQQDFWSKVG